MNIYAVALVVEGSGTIALQSFIVPAVDECQALGTVIRDMEREHFELPIRFHSVLKVEHGVGLGLDKVVRLNRVLSNILGEEGIDIDTAKDIIDKFSKRINNMIGENK